MAKPVTPALRAVVFSFACTLAAFLVLVGTISGAPQEQERVAPIAAPATPLPPEAKSAGITQFSFIAYGDTRGRRDGVSIQYEHSLVVDSMLQQIKKLSNTSYPVRFALQSGDAVQRGQEVRQWNISFVPLIDRLTTEGGIPYFLAPGNHDVSPALTVDDAKRLPGLRNYLDAVSALIPPDGSPRRLSGYPTYSFGYGNTFVIGLDANIAGDEKQFQWVKGQFEGLDRTRYANVLVFCHQAPFSSGPHGGSKVEQPTVELRARYMPLFHTHHVRAVFSGHEHLFEHWVEHYTDGAGTHRMDLVVSGGGGAPIYPYTGEPDLDGYLKANDSLKVSLQHLVKPGDQDSPTPYHYLIVKVDGDKLDMQVIGVDWGRNFAPYRSNEVELRDSLSAPR